MNLAIPSVPGFWPDYYVTSKKEILSTIKRMLEHSESDYPNSTLVGFRITKHVGTYYRIYPKVKYIHDFYPDREVERSPS